MRVVALFAIPLILATGCSVPELEHREARITMASGPAAPPETNVVPLSLPSEPMRSPGRGYTTFDKRSSPFPDYDEKMVRTIEKRWLELTPRIQMRGRGEVVVEFKLNAEGGVADVHVRPTRLLGIGVEICQQAILESAPFDPWPAEMRRVLGDRTREITFTFNYR